MDLSEDQNLIVIFGGRCDFASKKNNYQQILDDVWVLFLENLRWYQVKLKGQKPSARFSHSSAIIGPQMVIFGGLNEEHFCLPELYVLELDPFHQKRVTHDKKKPQQRIIEEPKILEDPLIEQFDEF
mmetsp:Transcript_25600/g.19365  ORF Transcript_25600/g.19365 Transcript_25600/m.19365 type:complete len:127 (-) Transcript_25600:34-414(-)